MPIKESAFFDVGFPTATFVSTAGRTYGDHYLIDGDFTLKGVTKPITLDVAFNGTHPGIGHVEIAHFDASVMLNRKQFGIDTGLSV